MSTGQAETRSGDAPLQGQKFAVRKTMSLCEEEYEPSSSYYILLRTRKGRRDCMLMGSQECNEYVSELLSTIGYVLVQPISIA